MHPVIADGQRELAEALFEAQRADNGSGSVARAEMLAAAILPVIERAEKRAEEELADLRQRLTALADDLDRLHHTAGQGEERGTREYGRALSTGIGYRRASLRLRDVLAGYEGSVFFGAMPWLRARAAALDPSGAAEGAGR